MPRDTGDDVYEELAREQATQSKSPRAKIKYVRPSKPCGSCGCDQKYHKHSRGTCHNTIETLDFSGPVGEQCWCQAFNTRNLRKLGSTVSLKLDPKIVGKGVALLDKVAEEWKQWASDSRAGNRDLNILTSLSTHLKDCLGRKP